MNLTNDRRENPTFKLNTDEYLILNFIQKNKRKLLKIFLLKYLYQLFYKLFDKKIESNLNYISVECYAMDSKIIQFLINEIIESGEYNLEGIAYHTRIPYDIIHDAACGINNQFSITPWAKVVDLYLKIKPDIEQMLVDNLLEIKNKNHFAFSTLLNEY